MSADDIRRCVDALARFRDVHTSRGKLTGSEVIQIEGTLAMLNRHKDEDAD